MTHQDLLHTEVDVLVSDPWEFGTECGAGPFPGSVIEASGHCIVIRLLKPVVFDGALISTVVASARHTEDSFDTVSECMMPANLVLQDRTPDAALASATPTQHKEIAAIGSVTFRAR